jgi:hypothetical protein
MIGIRDFLLSAILLPAAAADACHRYLSFCVLFWFLIHL